MKKGTKMTEEQRLKISKASLGKNISEEQRKKISRTLMGRKLSEEHKNKISKSQIGKHPSEETRAKLWKNHKGMTGKKHSLETRRKESESHKGSKNSAWKGGIAPANQAMRRSLEYKLWRTAVFVRDNFVCIWGGEAHGSNLCADHIKPFSLYPELRFAIDNGRTLCEACHKTTDTFAGRMKNYKLKD